MQINSIGNNRNNQISFGTHLSKEFLKVIDRTNPKTVEKELAKAGIKANFNGSKAIAACTQKTVEIFKALNLPLPKKITARKMPLVNGNQVNGSANTNFVLTFNTDILDDIVSFDELNTLGRKHRLVSTGHFLSTFLHEFSHNANFRNIERTLKKEVKPVFNKIQSLTPSYKIENYIAQKYGFYPQCNFFEIFADIMTAKLSKCLDRKTLMPKSNPFSAIGRQSSISKKESCLNQILNDIYNGNFTNLKHKDIN